MHHLITRTAAATAALLAVLSATSGLVQATPTQYVVEQTFSDTGCTSLNAIKILPFLPNVCTPNAYGTSTLYTCSSVTTYNTNDCSGPGVVTQNACSTDVGYLRPGKSYNFKCATYNSSMVSAYFTVVGDTTGTCPPQSLIQTGSTQIYLLDGTSCQYSGVTFKTSMPVVDANGMYTYFSFFGATDFSCSGASTGVDTVPLSNFCVTSASAGYNGLLEVYPWPATPAAQPTQSPVTAVPTPLPLAPPRALWFHYYTWGDPHNQFKAVRYYKQSLPHPVAVPPQTGHNMTLTDDAGNQVPMYAIELLEKEYVCPTVFPTSAPVVYFNVTAGDAADIGVSAEAVTQTLAGSSPAVATNILITLTFYIHGRAPVVYTANGQTSAITSPTVDNPPWTFTSGPAGWSGGSVVAFSWGRQGVYDTSCKVALSTWATIVGSADVSLDCMFSGGATFKYFSGDTCGAHYSVSGTGTPGARRRLASSSTPPACLAQNLTGDFLRACAYDISVTNDTVFAGSSAHAMARYVEGEKARVSTETKLATGLFDYRGAGTTLRVGSVASLAVLVAAWLAGVSM